jgi:hypothetical protein
MTENGKQDGVVAARVTEQIGAELDALAETERRKVGELARFALEEYVARRRGGAPSFIPTGEAAIVVPQAVASAWASLPEVDRQRIERSIVAMADGLRSQAGTRRKRQNGRDAEG